MLNQLLSGHDLILILLVRLQSIFHILILDILQLALNLFLALLRLTDLIQFIAPEVLEYLKLLLLLHCYWCVRSDSSIVERKNLLLKLLNIQWLQLTRLVTQVQIWLILLVMIVDAFYLQLLL